MCKVFGEVLRGEVELRLELYEENRGVLTVNIDSIDIANKILVKVWINYKKAVRL